MEGKEAGAARRERDFAPSLHGGGGICYGVAMSGETENENRRRIEKLEIGRETDKEIQEKNMQILESNMKQLLAENRAAFEKLRADVHKLVWVGLATLVTLFGAVVVLADYAFRSGGG